MHDLFSTNIHPHFAKYQVLIKMLDNLEHKALCHIPKIIHDNQIQLSILNYCLNLLSNTKLAEVSSKIGANLSGLNFPYRQYGYMIGIDVPNSKDARNRLYKAGYIVRNYESTLILSPMFITSPLYLSHVVDIINQGF